MVRVGLFLIVLAAAGAVHAEDVSLNPATVGQLRRLEPLTAEKIDLLQDAGRLTREQAVYVKRHVTRDGKLNLPAGVVREEQRPAPPPNAPARPGSPAARPAPPAAEPEARAPARPAVSDNPYARMGYRLHLEDQERLRRMIRDYRRGSRAEIGRELRRFRPQVNQLIAEAYFDPVDLPIRVALWEEVAGPANPDACIGLFEAHRAAYEIARPILVPHAKDIGGLVVRRRASGPDAQEHPASRYMTSREMRELILEIEGLIARCSSPTAAIFLLGVYANRYDEGEAPMRDKGRDRHRLVEACGGNPKEFDEGEPRTWSSTLSGPERVAIVDELLPYLHRDNGDRRKIVRNALMVCLGRRHPDWDDSRSEWERWWRENRERVAGEDRR